MPSPATITAYYSFTPLTRIKSAEVNANFDLFRGHLLPIDASTAAASFNAYDLGSTDHRWRNAYTTGISLGHTTTSWSIVDETTTVGALSFRKNSAELFRVGANGIASNAGSTGQYFKYGATQGSWASFAPPTVQRFTTGTTQTYTTPAGVLWIEVLVIGGGGGGAGGGTARGATAAGTGAASSFGFITALGGERGYWADDGRTFGGVPSMTATTTAAIIGLATGGGGGGGVPGLTASPTGGIGGNSSLGGGGAVGALNQAGGGGATNSGGGGGGGGGGVVVNNYGGGGGSAGGTLRAIIWSPAASYTYSVGGGGVAGVAGANGQAGGAGAAGVIVVIEHYQ